VVVIVAALTSWLQILVCTRAKASWTMTSTVFVVSKET
jgi:hypothetical protein